MTAIIAPSILSADFARLGEECRHLGEAGAEWIHVDVMDGHFVPNLTIGPAVCSALRPHISGIMDVHLMITPVGPLIDGFAEAGADILTVHVEAGPHPHRSCQQIRDAGMKVGIALNPATPASALAHLMGIVDLVCVMTVNPGFGGQAFIDDQKGKITEIASMVEGRDIRIEVDGGVTTGNARTIAMAGADVLVAGTAVFDAAGGPSGPETYRNNIAMLQAQAMAGLQDRLSVSALEASSIAGS